MKVGTLTSESESHGVRGETRVTFLSNATSFYANISGLATDKIGYPIRELCSNAWDAAKGDFEVTLPTPLNPIFGVKDFGPGLSHLFMTTRFAVMYDSDKREDMTKLGGWGLGRFSPFSYLLSEEQTGFYLITSRHEGVKSSYVMTLGDDGTPVLKTMSQENSDEPSGFEVVFSVMSKDIESFHEKAMEILWAFPDRPIITPTVSFSDFAPIIRGDSWQVMPQGSPIDRPYVRLGCVMYPINLESPGIVNPDPGIIRPNSRILFETSIDGVRPTLSREGLEYKSKTVTTINNLLETYASELETSLQNRIDGASSLFEADLIFCNTTESFLKDSETLRSDILWRGRPIPSLFRPSENRRFALLPQGWTLNEVKQFDGSFIISPKNFHGARIAIEHTIGQSMAKIEAAGLVGQKTMWIRCRSSDRERVLEEIGNPTDIINLSDFKIEVENQRPKTVRRRSMMPYTRLGRRDRETIEIDLSQPQYYIVIESSSRYSHVIRATNGRTSNLTRFDEAVRKAFELNLLHGTIAVAPIRSDALKIPDGWISFVQHVVDLLMPHIPLGEGSDWRNYQLSSFPQQVTCLRGLTSAPFQGLGGEIALLYRKYTEIANSALDYHAYNYGRRVSQSLYHILTDLGAVTEQGSSRDVIKAIQKEVEALSKRYPLLEKISDRPNYGPRDVQLISKQFKEYERLLLLDQKKNKRPSVHADASVDVAVAEAVEVRGGQGSDSGQQNGQVS